MLLRVFYCSVAGFIIGVFFRSFVDLGPFFAVFLGALGAILGLYFRFATDFVSTALSYETRFRWISFQFRARRSKNYEAYTEYLLNNFCKDVAEIEKKDAD
ncbi:MAG: hypothetical protein Q8P86_00255, partial [bacterium]|nr:hypothetical protein [bacterium]